MQLLAEKLQLHQDLWACLQVLRSRNSKVQACFLVFSRVPEIKLAKHLLYDQLFIVIFSAATAAAAVAKSRLKWNNVNRMSISFLQKINLTFAVQF